MVFLFLGSGSIVQIASSAPARKIRGWITNNPAETIVRVLAAGRFHRPTRLSLALKKLLVSHEGTSEQLGLKLLDVMTHSQDVVVDGH